MFDNFDFYNSGSGVFGNNGSGEGSSGSSGSSSSTPLNFGSIDYLLLPQKYNTNIAVTMASVSGCNINTGQSINIGRYFRAGETLNGFMFNAINANTADTSPVELTYVGFVTGANEATVGTSLPWGSGVIGLFGKNVLAKGTNTVSCEYSTTYATTGTILFETPMTFTAGTSIYINLSGNLTSSRVGRINNSLETVSAGTTITYGTSQFNIHTNSPQIKPLITGQNTEVDLFTAQTSKLLSFAQTSSCGAVIKPIVSGTVDGIWINIDADYNGKLHICDNANGNNIIGFSNISVNRPDTVGDGVKIFRLDAPVVLTKDGTYTITGTTDNIAGNLVSVVPFQDPYLKSLSKFSNSTLVTCSRSENSYPISGTTLNSTLYAGFAYSSISL